jgi:hypothetical protein
MSATGMTLAIGPVERAGQAALRQWLQPQRPRGTLQRLKLWFTRRPR